METITKIDLESNKTLFSVNHRAFIVLVRTLQFLKTRLRGIDEGMAVHIPQQEIESRFFHSPGYECKKELQKLVQTGQLRITESKSNKGRTMFLYEALQAGKADLYLIKPKAENYADYIQQMIEHLKHVSVDQEASELPEYFQAFLNFREDCMNIFVTVDDFSGRFHTPISNLHRPIRPHLLLYGQPTIGIDVVTMQPLLLGKLLKEVIGANEYSTWIEEGKDIYVMLQEKAGLETRDAGKKMFFEILFAPVNNKLTAIFGDAEWIAWINQYKQLSESRNPHNAWKPYSNVAWLLQSTEVKLMSKVWKELIYAEVPFLSVHDEVIVKQVDRFKAEGIFRTVMDGEFTFYNLSVKQAIADSLNIINDITPLQVEIAPLISISQPPAEFLPHLTIKDTRHTYIGKDGLLHIHYPGIPDLN